MQKEWYVVNTYSGHENKVKEKLEMRANSMGLEDYIFRVVVPEEKVVDEKGKEKTKKMFPGYILVEMVMTDEAWFIVRNTPGVTGFIGSSGKGAKPFPLTPAEVDKILGAILLYEAQKFLRKEKGVIVEVFVDDDSDTPITYNIHKGGRCVCHHHGKYWSVKDWNVALSEGLREAVKILTEDETIHG